MAVLVLEASTSSAKAMVYDAAKGALSVTSHAYGAMSDVATQDAEAVFTMLLSAGREAVDAAGVPIDVVSLGGTWHSMVLLDPETMAPVTRCYSWAYTGAGKTAGRLRRNAVLADRVYHATGCMIHTIYPAYKYLHLMETEDLPADLLCAGQGDYIFYRLTDHWDVSHSMASGTGLLNTHKLDWDEEVMALVGLSRERLPHLVPHTAYQPLKEEFADALGVPENIPVVPPHPDGAMNQVGAGAMGEGIMTLSVGTSGALRMAFDHPVMSDAPGGCWCYVGPGRWLCGAATNGATNCVDYLVHDVFGDRFTFDELEELAKNAGDDYPVFTPFLYGERCPGWSDNKRGGFTDMSGSHGVGQLYRALLEGVLMNIYHCFTILTGVSTVPAHIRVSGGILSNTFWTQMLADILQRPIECADLAQASMMGCAALGLQAEGNLPDLADFDPGAVRIVEPDPAKAAFYQMRFQKYLAAYND